MKRLSTQWRRWAGALTACLLAVLVLGPALDAVVCEQDGAVVSVISGVQTDHQPDGRHSEPAGVCVHGHCHQAFSEAPAIQTAVASTRADPQIYPMTPERVRVTNRQFKLIRPPRA